VITVAALLRERMGLDASSVGAASVRRAIRGRMARLGLDSIKAYRRALAGSDGEWKELVEAVVVVESWFFREPEAFRAFAEFVSREWLPRHPGRRLRILSLPCASGEEPYSVAMALTDAGVSAARFEIVAADISGRALARARAGFYGGSAFRGAELAFRDRFFSETGDGYMLGSAIRACVEFRQGNLLDASLFAGEPGFDLVFCRNLLIYFDAATQVTALERLRRLLAPEGRLLVGAAEQGVLLENGWEALGMPMLFQPAEGAIRFQRRPGERFQAVARKEPAPVAAASDGALGELSFGLLEMARLMFSQGRLDEAQALCEKHLEQRWDSANGYCLLGRIRQKRGDGSALECYRKAVYLEPDHYEALAELARLANRDGDARHATRYACRAQRVRPMEHGGLAQPAEPGL
jgi:chemotaxis protein methyltransferase WspC